MHDEHVVWNRRLVSMSAFRLGDLAYGRRTRRAEVLTSEGLKGLSVLKGSNS
jgi:hypothetical protein